MATVVMKCLLWWFPYGNSGIVVLLSKVVLSSYRVLQVCIVVKYNNYVAVTGRKMNISVGYRDSNRL